MLERGTWIRSRKGEVARDENDRKVQTGLNALGCITSIDVDGQGKPYYGVLFRNNVWVFLDDEHLAHADLYEVMGHLED